MSMPNHESFQKNTAEQKKSVAVRALKAALAAAMMAVTGGQAVETAQADTTTFQKAERVDAKYKPQVEEMMKKALPLVKEYNFDPQDEKMVLDQLKHQAELPFMLGNNAVLFHNKDLRTALFLKGVIELCEEHYGGIKLDWTNTDFESSKEHQLVMAIDDLRFAYLKNEKKHKEALQNIVKQLAEIYLGNTQLKDSLAYDDENLNIHFSYDTEELEDGVVHKRVTAIVQRKGSPNTFVLDLGPLQK